MTHKWCSKWCSNCRSTTSGAGDAEACQVSGEDAYLTKAGRHPRDIVAACRGENAFFERRVMPPAYDSARWRVADSTRRMHDGRRDGDRTNALRSTRGAVPTPRTSEPHALAARQG